MASPDFRLEPEAVRDMAGKFDTFGEVLSTISKVLEGAAMVLKTTAFIGMVGGAAVLHYIETIQPVIEQKAEKCLELSKDLVASVAAYEREDEMGATKFY